MKREKGVITMNLNKFKKIIYINEITFFFGWVIIFFLGADFPPPIDFIWLVVLTAVLDVIQYFYLKKFLPNLNNKTKRLFIKNLLFSLLAGIGLNLLTILFDLSNFLNTDPINALIWMTIIMIVAMIYGTYFYIINAILIKLIK